MPILLIDVVRAMRSLRRDTGFVVLGVLLFIALVGGSVAYWLLEDLSLFNALYLSVLTLTTVGYGDPAPATAAGKAFTMAFMLVGIGILLAFVSMLAEHIRRNSVLRGPVTKLAAHHDARRPPNEGEPREAPGLAELGDYDLLVVGAGEASRRTALEAARAGLRVVLVEDARDLPRLDAGMRAA